MESESVLEGFGVDGGRGVGEACGIVVTYHPDVDVRENLTKLKSQVGQVLVVDNGSGVAEFNLLREVCESLGAELIENGENLGIATALNIGLRRAEALGYAWVFLFDQDSQVTDGFADTMLRHFEETSAKLRLGILIPKYIDKRLGNAMKAIYEPDGRVETAMTSGCLLRMSTFRDHGLFVDELFIDGVDHEHSLRLRALGYSIEECFDAVLLHSPGSPTTHRVKMRAKPFLASNYSPIRRYYQERNKVWLVRRYWREFPSFSRRQVWVSLKEFIKILLFEPNKMPRARYFLLGLWHGMRGKMGKLREG